MDILWHGSAGQPSRQSRLAITERFYRKRKAGQLRLTSDRQTDRKEIINRHGQYTAFYGLSQRFGQFIDRLGLREGTAQGCAEPMGGMERRHEMRGYQLRRKATGTLLRDHKTNQLYIFENERDAVKILTKVIYMDTAPCPDWIQIVPRAEETK